MTGEKESKYGIGNVRSWQECWDYVGLDLLKKELVRPKEPWKLPDNYRPLIDEFCTDNKRCQVLQ
jgi:hypothetical protein